MQNERLEESWLRNSSVFSVMDYCAPPVIETTRCCSKTRTVLWFTHFKFEKEILELGELVMLVMYWLPACFMVCCGMHKRKSCIGDHLPVQQAINNGWWKVAKHAERELGLFSLISDSEFSYTDVTLFCSHKIFV